MNLHASIVQITSFDEISYVINIYMTETSFLFPIW